MALIRVNRGGAVQPSKAAVVSTVEGSSIMNAAYDNGSGETDVVNYEVSSSGTWNVSDLLSIAYGSDNFTITFKVDCTVFGCYGSTSISGTHAANSTITFNRSNILSAYIYA